MRRFSRIAIVTSDTREAIEAGERLGALYGNVDPVEADVIVALGGDGLMLQTLHRFMGSGKPIYGMNRGSVGFLMNEFQTEGLIERLEGAERSIVIRCRWSRPTGGAAHTARAITKFRCFARPIRRPSCASASTARYACTSSRRRGDGRDACRLDRVQSLRKRADPADERALLALTPIIAFRPRRWRGAFCRTTPGSR